MGRWDNSSGKRGISLRINRKKLKYIMLGGFVVVAIVVLSVFIPRAGLSVDLGLRSRCSGLVE